MLSKVQSNNSSVQEMADDDMLHEDGKLQDLQAWNMIAERLTAT